MFRAIFVLIALGIFGVTPAATQSRTAKDCDKIQNPMEFNLCLASLAPQRARTVPGTGRRSSAPEVSRYPQGVSANTVPGGRKQMRFDLKR